MDLLVSIGMGSHETFKSQRELSQHFMNCGVIASPVLQRAFGRLDRAFFANPGCNPPYGNYPIELNGMSNMPTPIMHAIPANEIVEHILPAVPHPRILDIGCGRGYFGQLMNTYLTLQKVQYTVHAQDLDGTLIHEANTLQSKIKDEIGVKQMVEFNASDYFKQQEFDYNILHFGFPLTHEELESLKHKLRSSTYVICPVQEPNSQEQWLTRLTLTNGEWNSHRIIKTIYQSPFTHDQTTAQTLLRLQADQLVIEDYIKNVHQNHSRMELRNLANNPQLMQQLKNLRIIKKKIKFLRT